MYSIPVTNEELDLVENIDEIWRELFSQAKTVDRSLIKVKKKFTLVLMISLPVLDLQVNSTPLDYQRASSQFPV